VIRFALRLAWRESRGARRPLAVLLVSVALGVAALAAVASVAGSVDRALTREAKALMGGDVELRSARALGPDAEAAVAALITGGATVARVQEVVAMARDPRGGATALVEVKGVDAAYPLYGAVVARPARPLRALLAEGGAIVDEALLARLRAGVGDEIVVGAATVTVRAVLVREPDRSTGLVRLGPRVLVAADVVHLAGLLERGSRVRHRALVRLPPPLAAGPTAERLARRLDDPAVRVATFEQAQPGLRRFFEQLGTYLGLIGLVSLLVAGIGVTAAVRSFMTRRRPTLAVLKCLGATSRVLLLAYLVQTAALGLAGGLLGAALGAGVQPLLTRLLAGVLPVALDPWPDPLLLARAVGIGLIVTVAAALWPLLEVRTASPGLLLRRDVALPAERGRRPWPVALAILAVLAAVAVWQAGSLAVGGIFVGAALAALGLLAVLGRALAGLGRTLPRPPSLAWRQGLANLRRPGGHTGTVVVALGVGVMVLVAVGLLEASLGRHIDHERRREAPSFFFVDIQPDQRTAFVALVERVGGATPALTPVVRARLAAVDGEPVTRAMLDRRRAEGHEALWYFTRDYVLTSAAALPAGNEVVAGRWWGDDGAGAPPRVSLEEGAARHLGVGPGATLAFDVQGVPIETRVANLRRVDWQSLTTNFFVVVAPGILDGAPTTYIATARVPAAREPALQDAVVAAFPNVTALPLRDVLDRVGELLGRIALAVRAVGFFTVAAGLVVMVGALAATRYQRLAESVILRTLGAPRGVVARIFAVEYACLGAAAGLGGTALAIGLAWAVLRWVLDVPATLAPGVLGLGLAVAPVVALAVGFLGTFRLLGEKPWPVLRRE
jgi:putative ABC transport system permease protein